MSTRIIQIRRSRNPAMEPRAPSHPGSGNVFEVNFNTGTSSNSLSLEVVAKLKLHVRLRSLDFAKFRPAQNLYVDALPNRLGRLLVASTRAAEQSVMASTSEIDQKAASVTAKAGLKNLRSRVKASDGESGSKHAIEEINAYIAIRDILLVEAEKVKTRANLDRVTVANEFVETCLRPARSPYQAQCLAETDAVRERKRCAVVKVCIAELRQD